MNNLNEIIISWQLFYATLATACTAFIGLIFVAFTFKADSIGPAKRSSDLILLERIFGDFIAVIIISFIFLIPKISVLGLSISIFIAAIMRLLFIIKKPISIKINLSVRSSRLSFLGSLGLALTSVFLYLGYNTILYWAVLPILILAISACISAWRLLTKIVE